MKVLIFPKGDNPYQELLYSKLRKKYPKDTFTYIEPSKKIFLLYPIIMLIRRFQGYNVFHIHWLAFSSNIQLPFIKVLSYFYTILCLNTLKILNYKVVWTVHNIIPHEKETMDDEAVSVHLSVLSAAKIAHARISVDHMKESGLDVNRTTIIPHGNYEDVYANNISEKKARRRLGLTDSEFVILFFGALRPYKGIDDLLKVFSKIKTKNVRLLIAGKSSDIALSDRIRKAQSKYSINFYEGYVEEDDIAMYFKASDVVCLPFRSITTSGSALLALSFGKPLIAPLQGALLELPAEVGFMYDPAKKNGLQESLTKAIEDKDELANRGKAAIKYARTLSWDRIADQTYQVYETVLKDDGSIRM